MKYVFSLISACIGAVSFWGIFFKLTPFITSCLPNNEWHKFLSIAIYVFVGWFGGIAIPLVFFGLAIYILFAYGK